MEIEEGKPLRFKAEVAVAPEVQLGEYKGIRVEKLVEQVEEKDIDHILEHLQEDQAELVYGRAEHGRKGRLRPSSISKGSSTAQPFEGGAAKGYTLQIGSGRLIEGFEEQLVGAEVGVETEVKVTFPRITTPKQLRGQRGAL